MCGHVVCADYSTAHFAVVVLPSASFRVYPCTLYGFLCVYLYMFQLTHSFFVYEKLLGF